MPASIVVGGQYGSEGKGKALALLCDGLKSPWLVRCGGPNSRHTVTLNGESLILRQVPSASDPTDSIFCIAVGCVMVVRNYPIRVGGNSSPFSDEITLSQIIAAHANNLGL